jgi:hypothetical protein
LYNVRIIHPGTFKRRSLVRDVKESLLVRVFPGLFHEQTKHGPSSRQVTLGRRLWRRRRRRSVLFLAFTIFAADFLLIRRFAARIIVVVIIIIIIIIVVLSSTIFSNRLRAPAVVLPASIFSERSPEPPSPSRSLWRRDRCCCCCCCCRC